MPGPDVSVVIVDGHHLFAQTLQAALEQEGIAVGGVAGSVAEALRLVAERSPDVVLVDRLLPDGTGAEATRTLRARHPGLQVVMVTESEDAATLSDALLAGCSGFVTKTGGVGDVVTAVRAAVHGQAVVPPALLARLFGSPSAPEPHGLSARELEVLRGVADGRSIDDIAAGLGLSLVTVRNHLQRAMRKLDAHSRVEALAKAIREGVIPPPH